jgi:hypothetical protein
MNTSILDVEMLFIRVYFSNSLGPYLKEHISVKYAAKKYVISNMIPIWNLMMRAVLSLDEI